MSYYPDGYLNEDAVWECAWDQAVEELGANANSGIIAERASEIITEAAENYPEDEIL